MYSSKPANIDEYIARFPKDVQGILEELRATKRLPLMPKKLSAIKCQPSGSKGTLCILRLIKTTLAFTPHRLGLRNSGSPVINGKR